MSQVDDPSVDPSLSPQAELASGLTELREKLDAAVGEVETVRAEAEAKMLALCARLKQISVGMSTLEVAISLVVAAPGEAAAVNGAPEIADGTAAEATDEPDVAADIGGGAEVAAEAGDAQGAGAADGNEAAEATGDRDVVAESTDTEDETEIVSDTEAESEIASNTEATEDTGTEAVKVEVGRDTVGADRALEDRPVADLAPRKEQISAADIAAAMLQDLALESPPRLAVLEPSVAGASGGPSAAGHLVSYPSREATTSSPVDAILEQEFAGYFEPAVVPSPALGPTIQTDDAKKSATDEWA